jgi:hypothetical protein
MSKLRWFLPILLVFAGMMSAADRHSQASADTRQKFMQCPANGNFGFCAELSRPAQEIVGHYSGHDEPAITFYSHKPGAGNNVVYKLNIPTDPAVPPQQDGTGGTFNFQLHPAFWFSMVLCDTQSSPNFTHLCSPNTDANIFDNPDPNAPDFIGHHPGSAFLELQFYPPGGINTCADPQLWCVAMVIFSFNSQDLTGKVNNADCRNNVNVGLEPDNFAFLTTDGIAQTPADPLNLDFNTKFGVFPGHTFQMQPGDHVIVDIHDTPDGLRAEVKDLTSHTSGFMTASLANGFAQVNFDPDPDPTHPTKTCSSTPYAFHPQFATASEHTRAVWTAHTVNIAFSDEIGHYELCNAVDQEGGNCIQAGAQDPGGIDFDDQIGGCFSGAFLGLFGLQPIGACINGDFDFDGTSYRFLWPGTGDAATDARLKPSPIRFSSPRFRKTGDDDDDHSLHNFSRVAFETDIVGVEFLSNPTCNLITGAGCTSPPSGAQFYPIYSTARTGDDGCMWQLGGPHIPDTIENFGGTSAAEYGDFLRVFFVTPINANHPKGGSIAVISDNRRILDENPCRSHDDDDHGDDE